MHKICFDLDDDNLSTLNKLSIDNGLTLSEQAKKIIIEQLIIIKNQNTELPKPKIVIRKDLGI